MLADIYDGPERLMLSTGFRPKTACRESLKLLGKAGSVVTLEPELDKAGLLDLWYGVIEIDRENIPPRYGAVTHGDIYEGDEIKFLLERSKRRVHAYSPQSWTAVMSAMDSFLGIKPVDDMPVFDMEALKGDRETVCLALETILEESRRYRALSPTLDRLSKRAFHPIHKQTTWNKFRESYGIDDTVHLGCGLIGRMSGIGSRGMCLIDPLLNGISWQEIEFEGRVVISDVAMPNESKTGMGKDNQLYEILRGEKSLYKMNYCCMNPMDTPVYKGRDHNLEIICVSASWGPADEIEVSADRIVETNGLRNILCQRVVSYETLRDRCSTAPEIDNPDYGRFYKFQDVIDHLSNQLDHVHITPNYDHTQPRRPFEKETFEMLIACRERYFNPCLPIPTNILGMLRRKDPKTLRRVLGDYGLDAHQAANVFLWKTAQKGRSERFEQVNALAGDSECAPPEH